MTMQTFGTTLARLGGADLDVLSRAKQVSRAGAAKDQARFVALGSVLLATASLAVLSMIFAMTDGLHVGLLGAVCMGIFWGVIILVVDRALILSLKPKGSRWLLFWMILPRILMAALLGLVISTPLTLRIFNDEIEQQMTLDNIKKAETASAALAGGDRQQKLEALKTEIATYEGYLAGDVPVTSPQLIAAEDQLKKAETAATTQDGVTDKAWRAWRCELDGELCDAGSGKSGNGVRAQALKRVYDREQREATAARRLVQTKRTALEGVRTTTGKATGAKVAEAQTEANRVLPGLRNQRDLLQGAIQGDLQTSSKEAADDTGLLARLVALSNLGEDNSWARMAHILVALLLFMLELLPVAVKSLSILGPPTAYDQIDDLDTKQVVKAAGRQDYIDRDLEQRKKRIAADVHDEVEKVMRELATEQVKAWKQKVQQMSVTPPPLPPSGNWAGNNQNIYVPPANRQATAVPGQRATALAKVAAALNLPPSTKHTP